VIASRGGKAAPEAAPFVIEYREALIYILCEAAELEHGIMCQYLFAAFSLKQCEDEGLTANVSPGARQSRMSRSRRCSTSRSSRTCCRRSVPLPTSPGQRAGMSFDGRRWRSGDTRCLAPRVGVGSGRSATGEEVTRNRIFQLRRSS
jgi:hypothetical protein